MKKQTLAEELKPNHKIHKGTITIDIYHNVNTLNIRGSGLDYNMVIGALESTKLNLMKDKFMANETINKKEVKSALVDSKKRNNLNKNK